MSPWSREGLVGGNLLPESEWLYKVDLTPSILVFGSLLEHVPFLHTAGFFTPSLTCYNAARIPHHACLDFPAIKSMRQINLFSLLNTQPQVFCYSNTKWTKPYVKDHYLSWYPQQVEYIGPEIKE